ncbi:MAG: 30S ribosomal protein S16 [Candidatus Omnitrophota bacterium]|jgi:small subunit ribosomal protein S16|nr:MAG: 30S ribosomal protein S16 [Candidatus Omnitrophota bacterium]
MAVRIRLRRIGKNPKGKPHFRVSVFEETTARDGRFIEELGFYDPSSGKLDIKADKFESWVKNGAQPSDTLKSLFKKLKKGGK